MTEQGIMSWLPTFNEKVLHLPEKISVNIALILALSIAGGRLLSGIIVNYIKWFFIVLVGLAGAALIIVLVLPQTDNLSVAPIEQLSDVPWIGFIFPLVGLFLAPIYPLMNSVVLGVTDRGLHSAMAGLLTFFSALGGTIGSRIVGYLFQSIGGSQAFYFALIPLTLLVVSLFFLYRQTQATALPK
jgi:fucose permease